jgi:hypothetical protein
MSGQRRHVTRVLVTVCGLVLGLAACGGAGEREASASEAATVFEQARDAGDRTALCAALAPNTRGELEDSEKKACVDVIDAQEVPAGGPVDRVEVYGRQARVRLASDTLFLSQFRDGWKIVAAGCRSRPGQPYQCSVKGG